MPKRRRPLTDLYRCASCGRLADPGEQWCPDPCSTDLRDANNRVYFADDLSTVSESSEIVPGLWQGRRPTTYVGYDLVISCERHLAKRPMEGYDGVTIHLPFDDEDVEPSAALSRGVFLAALAAKHVLATDGKVRIHCTGGLNRSSLVTVETLVLLGHERRAAVALLRGQHDGFCLCNRTFERWALREPLPTAETTTLG